MKTKAENPPLWAYIVWIIIFVLFFALLYSEPADAQVICYPEQEICVGFPPVAGSTIYLPLIQHPFNPDYGL